MKCRQQPEFLRSKPDKISDIWEIRMPRALWLKVVRASQQRQVTLSRITRFCAFQLAEKQELPGYLNLCKSRNRDRTELRDSVEIHRHLVCLYGQDAELLRLAALRLGVSVSVLIRIAIRLYIDRLALDIHSRRFVTDDELFIWGIKRWFCIQTTALNRSGLPHLRQQTFSTFPPWLRWN